MARNKVKTGPAYINDELLKVALLGTRHQPLGVTALPAALQVAATQILARDEPESALFTLLNLNSTLERASNEGLVKVSSKIARVKPPQVVGERYLPAEVMTKLLDPEISAVEWTAILARFRGTGLKVPSHCSQAFLRNFKNLRSELHPLYRDFPIEFLGIEARFVEQYTSDEDLMLEPRSWDDLGSSERKAKVAELLVQHAYDAALDLLEGSFMGLSQDLRLGILQLWEAHWFEFLCYGYRSGLLPAKVEAKNVPFDAESLGQVFVEFLSKTYGAQVMTSTVDRKQLEMSDVAAQVEVALQTPAAGKLAISAQASVRVQSDCLYPLGPASSVVQRVEYWLLSVMRSEHVCEVKEAAARLLRMLPGGRFESHMVEFVRKVFSVNRDGCPIIRRGLARSHQEIAASLVTFFPELSEDPYYVREEGRAKLSNMDRFYIKGVTLFLPPQQWFELFKIKRSGNDSFDASYLFHYFSGCFPGWDFLTSDGSRKEIFIHYVALRTHYELGPTYFEAFCKQCREHRCWNDYQIEFLSRLSYEERESCPLVSGSAAARFDYGEGDCHHQMWLFEKSAQAFFTEPLACWGPKVSEFYLGQYLDQFKVGQHIAFLEFEPHDPTLCALALSLDPQVRARSINRIKQLIAVYADDLARLKQQGSHDYYRRNDSRTAHYNLQMLLRYFDWADELNELCAWALPAAA